MGQVLSAIKSRYYKNTAGQEFQLQSEFGQMSLAYFNLVSYTPYSIVQKTIIFLFTGRDRIVYPPLSSYIAHSG